MIGELTKDYLERDGWEINRYPLFLPMRIKYLEKTKYSVKTVENLD